MVETALVAEPTRSSLVLLKDLEEHGLPIEAAFWLLDPESRIWYLYVASPGIAEQGARRAYELVQEAIERTGVEIPLAQVKMISPRAGVLRNLRAAAKVSGWSWVAFRHNTVNGVFIEDAVLLRT